MLRIDHYGNAPDKMHQAIRMISNRSIAQPLQTSHAKWKNFSESASEAASNAASNEKTQTLTYIMKRTGTS